MNKTSSFYQEIYNKYNKIFRIMIEPPIEHVYLMYLRDRRSDKNLVEINLYRDSFVIHINHKPVLYDIRFKVNNNIAQYFIDACYSCFSSFINNLYDLSVKIGDLFKLDELKSIDDRIKLMIDFQDKLITISIRYMPSTDLAVVYYYVVRKKDMYEHLVRHSENDIIKYIPHKLDEFHKYIEYIDEYINYDKEFYYILKHINKLLDSLVKIYRYMFYMFM